MLGDDDKEQYDDSELRSVNFFERQDNDYVPTPIGLDEEQLNDDESLPLILSPARHLYQGWERRPVAQRWYLTLSLLGWAANTAMWMYARQSLPGTVLADDRDYYGLSSQEFNAASPGEANRLEFLTSTAHWIAGALFAASSLHIGWATYRDRNFPRHSDSASYRRRHWTSSFLLIGLFVEYLVFSLLMPGDYDREMTVARARDSFAPESIINIWALTAFGSDWAFSLQLMWGLNAIAGFMMSMMPSDSVRQETVVRQIDEDHPDEMRVVVAGNGSRIGDLPLISDLSDGPDTPMLGRSNFSGCGASSSNFDDPTPQTDLQKAAGNAIRHTGSSGIMGSNLQSSSSDSDGDENRSGNTQGGRNLLFNDPSMKEEASASSDSIETLIQEADRQAAKDSAASTDSDEQIAALLVRFLSLSNFRKRNSDNSMVSLTEEHGSKLLQFVKDHLLNNETLFPRNSDTFTSFGSSAILLNACRQTLDKLPAELEIVIDKDKVNGNMTKNFLGDINKLTAPLQALKNKITSAAGNGRRLGMGSSSK